MNALLVESFGHLNDTFQSDKLLKYRQLKCFSNK